MLLTIFIVIGVVLIIGGITTNEKPKHRPIVYSENPRKNDKDDDFSKKVLMYWLFFDD